MTSDSTYTRGEGERLTIHRCSDCGHDSLDPFDARCPECHSGSYQPIFVMRVSDHKAELAEEREIADGRVAHLNDTVKLWHGKLERAENQAAELGELCHGYALAVEAAERERDRAEAVLREIADTSTASRSTIQKVNAYFNSPPTPEQPHE